MTVQQYSCAQKIVHIRSGKVRRCSRCTMGATPRDPRRTRRGYLSLSQHENLWHRCCIWFIVIRYWICSGEAHCQQGEKMLLRSHTYLYHFYRLYHLKLSVRRNATYFSSWLQRSTACNFISCQKLLVCYLSVCRLWSFSFVIPRIKNNFRA